MNRKPVILTTIGLIMVAVLGLGLYGNYMLDNIIDRLVQSGPVEINGNAPGNSAAVSPNQAEADPASVTEGKGTAPGGSGSAPNVAPSSPAPISDSITPQQNAVAQGAVRYLGRSVAKQDLLIAGNILLQRLSAGEMNYLYGVGSRGLRSSEETRQVRALLLGRLSSGDVATLTALGNKYGLSLKILDASYPIP